MSTPPTTRVTYNPQIFDVRNIDQARQIILTGEGSTTDERWVSETPWLADEISNSMPITTDSIIIDYGCGIGRMSKELISRYGCRVVGVDISDNMRALAIDYVRSNRFMSVSPEMLDALVERGFQADAGIAIWVLQHCLKPNDDIERIHRTLKSGAEFFLLNNIYRAVPTREKPWVNDGLDIKALVGEHFAIQREGIPPLERTPRDLVDIIFWAAYKKDA
jgi:SAM-dependent methyltransferase